MYRYTCRCVRVHSLVVYIHICHICDKQEREHQHEMTQNKEEVRAGLP